MIIPLPGYCLIEPIEDETKTSGGLYTPETDKDKPSRGRVIAISPNFTDFSASFSTPFISSPVKVGQVIIYKKFVNETVNKDGKELLFVKYENVLGIENE